METLALVALVLAAAEPSAAVDHVPLACVPAERYARVAIRADATGGAAELQFRTGESGGWYGTRMAAEGQDRVAFLPRPARATGEIEYRIVVTRPSADAVTAGPYRARIGAAGECDTAGRASVDAPIVVTVPAGAPLVPPVPAGFSPAGVVAAAPPKRSNLTLKIAGGVAAAAVIGITAAATAETTGAPPTTGAPTVPPISFNGIEPPPGSTVNYNRERVVVHMVMAARPDVVLTLFWRVDFRRADGRSCLEMSGTSTATPDSNEFFLTAPLVSSGACGFQFDTEAVHIGISHQNQRAYEQTPAIPYHFVS